MLFDWLDQTVLAQLSLARSDLENITDNNFRTDLVARETGFGDIPRRQGRRARAQGGHPRR